MHISNVLLFTILSGSWATLLFPGSIPLHKRQSIAPGTPLYECHANCGGVIVSARSENYCSNSTFTSELKACLNCALTYDIWQYYGGDVSTAAKKCGDNATPSPSSAVSATASTMGTTTLATSVAGTGASATTTSSSFASSAPVSTTPSVSAMETSSTISTNSGSLSSDTAAASAASTSVSSSGGIITPSHSALSCACILATMLFCFSIIQ